MHYVNATLFYMLKLNNTYLKLSDLAYSWKNFLDLGLKNDNFNHQLNYDLNKLYYHLTIISIEDINNNYIVMHFFIIM